MASAQSNGSAHDNGVGGENGSPRQQQAGEENHSGGPITEAVALKDALHQAYGSASRLVAALKRQRKQSRLVTSTLASLRALQHIDG
jgi:hypothetical protein